MADSGDTRLAVHMETTMEIESASCGGVAEPHKDRKMGSTILECFTKLVRDKERERLLGGVALLRHMYHKKQEDAESKELSYALTRLVRGLGSSRALSRKGFYTTLVAYLRINSDIRVEDLIKIMDAELHPVNSNAKSENADIFMGRILLCGAIIRSKMLERCTVEEQQKVFEVLFVAGQKRNYLSFISVSFLIDYIDQLDAKTLKAGIWPLLKIQLGKPWAEQTLDTFYVLLIMKDKFPTLVSAKFLREHLGTEDIIDAEHMKELLKLLTDIPRIMCCRHPVFKLFCEKLVLTEHLVEFWSGMDQRFTKPSKSIEYLGLEMLKHVLTNLSDKSLVPSLLTPNFLQHMLRRLTACKRNRQDEVATGFKSLLAQLVTVMKGEDIKAKTQVGVLKKLIHYPGDLMIEKKTGTKVVQLLTSNMNADGVKKLSKLYHEIASNSKPKVKKDDATESWTNVERNYAAQLLTRLLGHPAVSAEQKWRVEQLKFLFNHGLCEAPNVGVELAPQFKESFYRALDHKLPKLSDLRTVLSELIHHLDDAIFVNKTSTLRTPLTEPAIEAWKQMMTLKERITKLEGDAKNKHAVSIFYTMDLMMGLQLFSDPEMAVSAINEIHSCSERLSKKKSKKAKKNDDKVDEEPEWVEVIVDLMLSLLSRNSHLLRSLVGCVFPHVCPVLTASSIHQIISVLDPKNDKSPLVAKGDEDDSSNDDEDSDSAGENDDDEDNDDESKASTASAEEAESGSDAEEENDDEDDDDDDDDDDEDETVTDRLRLAVRQALGDACVQTDDEDIDVDQIDEDQGKRLDESLAAAFRILRENRQSPSKKQEKSAQSLTHFRVRVMDLLEAYIDSGPSMALALDMLVPLFALLEYCIKDPHQKPLENRVRACLKKLSGVKKFKDTEGVDAQLLTDVSKLLMEKGERSTAICQEMGDKLAECSTFLVRCVQQAGLPAETLVQIYGENLTAFFKKRDCVLPAGLFKSALQLLWAGNWQLAPLLVDYAFDNSIRSFRRSQALEFLTIFYRNNRLVKGEEHNAVRLKMEKKLYSNSVNLLSELSAAQQNGQSAEGKNTEIGKEVRQKFVGLLLNLLHVVYPHHLPKAWDWKAVASAIVEYRTHVTLAKDAKSAYNRLASQIGAPIYVPTKANEQPKAPLTNGTQSKHANGVSASESDTEDEETSDKTAKKEAKKKLKTRSKQKDKQKLKKEARELRAKAMSEGLESFDFSSVKLENGNVEEPMETNGVSDDDSKPTKSPKKRSNHEPVDTPSKTKKKKKNVEAKQ